MELATRVKEIINEIKYITIATSDKDGQPWNTPVFSAFDENYNFYWNSTPHSQHSKNIANNSKVFLVIYNSSAAEGKGEGVYVLAKAKEIADESEIFKALELLKNRAQNFHYKSPSDFLGDNPRRVYKAVPEKFWMNTDEKIDGYHNDGRIEINELV